MSVIYKSFVLLRKGVIKYNNIYWNPSIRHLTTPVPNKTEQIDFIKSAIESNKSESNWSSLKNNVLCKEGNLNEKNVDAVILKIMVTNKKFNVALSFANYLQSSNQELTLGATNSLLSLYYEYAKEFELSETEKKFILNTYTSLYQKYKELDSATGEKLLHALCAINEWKKSMTVLDDIVLTGIPTHSAYSTLIGTLFRNNKKAEALRMIEKSENNRRPLQHFAYDEWIKYIFRKYKDIKTITKYLNELCNHISKNCTVVPAATAQRLKESFKAINWMVNFTEIKKPRGECQSCNQTLDCLSLTTKEFTTLEQNIKEKLIVGSDLFLKTSPEELKRFTEFFERTGPYDIVMDALNIAYLAGKGGINDRLKMLTAVVNHFVEKKKKILLLGRKHMLKWNRGSLQQLMKKTDSFFTENLSQDDPYFITAAILSGPHTDIVSRDLLRGHRFLLQNEELRQLFQRWQWQHQWMVFPSKYLKPVIQEPLKFTPIAQHNSIGWHLPCEAENAPTLGQFNDGVPDGSSWICMRPKPN